MTIVLLKIETRDPRPMWLGGCGDPHPNWQRLWSEQTSIVNLGKLVLQIWAALFYYKLGQLSYYKFREL